MASKKAPPHQKPTTLLLVRHGQTPTTGQSLPGRAPGLHLSETGLKKAEEVAERIIEMIRQPFLLHGQQVHSGASVGIAYFSHEHSKAEALLRDADAAMYQAKSMGRNRFVIFNETMREQMLQALTIEQVMLQALEQQQFIDVYEPVLCGAESNLIGYEVHAQCQHPQSQF